MDNNNEYKRNVDPSFGFPSYDDLPKMDDYSSMGNYESPVNMDLGGYYTASYQAPEEDGEDSEATVEEKEAPSASPQGINSSDGMSKSVYEALYSDYDDSQANNNYRTSPYSATSDGNVTDADTDTTYATDAAYGQYNAKSSVTQNDGYTSDYSGGSDSYTSNYSSGSSMEGSYGSSGGMGSSYGSNDGYTSDYGGSSMESSYGSNDGYTSDYSGNSMESSYGGSDGYKDYNAPKEDYASYGNSFGASNSIPDTNAVPNANTVPNLSISNAVPLDKKGRPLKNRFGMKMVFSVIELFFATLWGVLGLIFTCMANNAYQKRDWDGFKSKSRLASIMLWVGFAVCLIEVAVLGVFISSFSLLGKNYHTSSSYVEEVPTVEEPVVDEPVVDEEQTSGESTAKADFPAPEEYNTFKMNGMALTVPSKVSDYVKVLKESGYEFTDDFKKAKLEPHDASYFDFVNKDGYIVGFVEVYNTTEEQMDATAGTVGGIYIDVNFDDKIQIDYMGRLDNNSSAQDYIDIFGEPNSADEDYGYYQWYTEEGWISIDLKDGELDSFTVYAYEGLR